MKTLQAIMPIVQLKKEARKIYVTLKKISKLVKWSILNSPRVRAASTRLHAAREADQSMF